MSLDDIAQINITNETVTLTRAGFGTPLIMRYHNFPWIVKAYSSSIEMIEDGWSANDPAVQIAVILEAANPKVTLWKIGKRTNVFTQVVQFVPINTTEGFIYEISIRVGSTVNDISYTVPAAATVAGIVTALQALVDAVTGITATDQTTHVEVTTDTDGDLVNYSGFNNPDNIGFVDVTTDPGITADLNAVEIEDSNWYGLLLDSQSQAEVESTALWSEANKKFFVYNTMDSDVTDPLSTTDVWSVLQGLAYVRTLSTFNSQALLSWMAAGAMGRMFPTNPGSSTWVNQTLTGVPVDNLKTNQKTALKAKNGLYYISFAQNSLLMTQGGKTPGGEWPDVTRFLDWLRVRMQEDIAVAFAAAEKLPYTDAGGLATVENILLARLESGVTAGGLVAKSYNVVVPKADDVDVVDKGNRHLPDVTFNGKLQGAIHTVDVTGVVSV